MTTSKGASGASLEEIELLYRKRLPAFLRVACAVLGDRERARDAVQDAFAAAVRRRGEFRGDGPLAAWVWRIVVNSARNEGRALADEERVLRTEITRNGSTPRGDDLRVRLAFTRLPERQRVALFLRHYADLDYEAIATALDVRPGTVGSTLASARTNLRKLLEELEP